MFVFTVKTGLEADEKVTIANKYSEKGLLSSFFMAGCYVFSINYYTVFNLM